MRWYGEEGALFGYSLIRDNQEAAAHFFYSCNVSCKTEFLVRNNGFNEALTVYEDNELGYRLAADGMKMTFRRAALGFHNQRFTFAQACQRIQRYSVGLPAFVATDAGKEMSRRNKEKKHQLILAIANIGIIFMKPLRPLIDSRLRFPNNLYRLFYWYYATRSLDGWD
jgi:hypothetical protein